MDCRFKNVRRTFVHLSICPKMHLFRVTVRFPVILYEHFYASDFRYEKKPLIFQYQNDLILAFVKHKKYSFFKMEIY